MSQEILNTDIKYIKGVGPKKAETLAKELSMHNFGDMIQHYPFRYVDRSKFYKVREINNSSAYIQLRGFVIKISEMGEGRKRRLTAIFHDDTGTIELVWFKGIQHFKDFFRQGQEYVIFGKPSKFNNKYNIAHPEIEPIEKHMQQLYQNAFLPIYHTTERMKKNLLNSKQISNIQAELLRQVKDKIEEVLPASIIEQNKLIALEDAYRAVHFPKNIEELEKAQLRLKFDEFFYNQIKILQLKVGRSNALKGAMCPSIGFNFNYFYENNLPFSLTNAQKRVVKEIRSDMCSGRQMNRLIQGDVGSGKTLVALMSCLIAIDNGFQTCIMAPTEILANQHFSSISNFVLGTKLNVKLLTGSSTKTDREIISEELSNGSINLLIGTHALIEGIVQFKNLGLAVIDEQHRFGVAQRAKLWKKNTDIVPHVLVMTATPIPRTLAMTLYGDLDTSQIDELPPGRKPIDTRHIYENNRNKVYGFIRQELQKGRQAYFVYPLVTESEKLDYKNVEDGRRHIQEVFDGYKVSMVHGKMKASEKDAEMIKFKEGRTHIMVATTVIEVGVDVPNASIMVIENAERFGLSQLHQLRGRVGRGSDQSYCILISTYKLSQESRKRLETMTETSDGFIIAEVDLKLRGPGDIEGLQQSGSDFGFKIASLSKDYKLLQHCRLVAQGILDDDPKLEQEKNATIKKQLDKMRDISFQWEIIS
ncbi:MAG: ATP-dependent DNA helicase RecG [Bacteroidales bacterium]